MNIRKKTLLTVSIIFVAMIAGIAETSRIIVLESYRHLEYQNMETDIRRAERGIAEVIESLKSTATDWAFWDDTYNFVQNSNTDYIETNLGDSAISMLKVNLMVFVSNSGQIIHAKFLDWVEKKEIQDTELMLNSFMSVPSLTKHSDNESIAAGVLMTRHFPVLLVSKPILKSDFTGPVMGALILGRFLDSEEIRRIGTLTHLNLDIRASDDPNLPADFQTACSQTGQGISTPVFPLNPESVAAYSVQNDLEGKPAFILKVEETRSIYHLGQKTIFYHIVFLIVIGVICILILSLFLNRLVLSPLKKLNTEVSSVRFGTEKTQFVSVSRKDEFGELAAAVNRMLGQLAESASDLQKRNSELEREIRERQTAESALRESETRMSAILAALPDILFIQDTDGLYLEYHAPDISRLLVRPEKIIGRNMRDVLPHELAERLIPSFRKLIETDTLQSVEYSLSMPEGFSWYETRIVRCGKDRILSVIRDITGRKRAEQELNRTLEKIETANKKTMDSIRYARTIQLSLLPRPDIMKSCLRNTFSIWKPRDIVGGDMLFADFFVSGLPECGLCSFIGALIDCTGHGVPGAFMTMIASSALRRIIKDEGCHDPAEILKRLNIIVKTTLQQDTEYAVSDDGMEAGIYFIPDVSLTAEKTLIFSGAGLRLYCVCDGEVSVIRGDKKNIGYRRSNLDFSYSNHRIAIKKDISFYMATDGYTDQMGGQPKRRFGTPRFKKLLSEICGEPFEEQEKILLKKFDEHREDNEQTDDVTVVGFGF